MSESVCNFEKLFDKLNNSHNEAIKELFRIQAVTVKAQRFESPNYSLFLSFISQELW